MRGKGDMGDEGDVDTRRVASRRVGDEGDEEEKEDYSIVDC
jgi:hypothetical protein